MNRKNKNNVLIIIGMVILLLAIVVIGGNYYSVGISTGNIDNSGTTFYFMTFNNQSNPATPIATNLQIKGNWVYGPVPPPNSEDNHFFTLNCNTTPNSVSLNMGGNPWVTGENFFNNPNGNTGGYVYTSTMTTSGLVYNMSGDLCSITLAPPYSQYGISLEGNVSEIINGNSVILGTINGGGIGGSGGTQYIVVMMGISPKTLNYTAPTIIKPANISINKATLFSNIISSIQSAINNAIQEFMKAFAL